MFHDFEKTAKDLLLYLHEYDKAWKSQPMKDVFPDNAKDRIENVEDIVNHLKKHSEIRRYFSEWRSIGVWNASDFLTFLLSSRLSFYIADQIEEKSVEGVRQAIEYLLFFINYLLLTNIHPPSESHGDLNPYHPRKVSFPRTYEKAQEDMRAVLAKHFAERIWSDKDVKEEFEEALKLRMLSADTLEDQLREKFLPQKTPPLQLKNVGLAKELFVFHKLVSEDLGFVIPTLLYQRIFKGVSAFLEKQKRLVLLRAPDFMVVKGGTAMGIEVGRERQFFDTRKGALITSFSGASAIPTTQINVLIGNPSIQPEKWYDFGYKCNKCYRSFTLCKAFIEGESHNRTPFDQLSTQSIACRNICGEERAKSCPDAVAYVPIMNYKTDRLNHKFVHYSCLSENEKKRVNRIVPFYPKVEGIEVLREGLA